MPGGMIFEIAAVRLRDQFGCVVICTLCGGTLWDVRIKGSDPDQIDCSNPVCGRPLDAAAVDGISEAGR